MINLHMHYNYSLDGKIDSNKVLDMCADNNMKYISITDHDTCNSYFDIDTTKTKFKGTIIYGMEADAVINDTTYDILCYGFNLDNVSKWATNQYGTVQTRQTKIFNKLKEICTTLNIKLDETTPFNPDIEFAHAALFRMLENISENKPLFEKYNINRVGDLYREGTQNKEFPLYIDMNFVWPRIQEVADVIHNNGGKIFLAHPYRYQKNVDDVLNDAFPYTDGIEIYNENTEEEVLYLYNFAKKHNLLISCGSDFHGSEKHNNLKINHINNNMQEEILSWINNINNKTIL